MKKLTILTLLFANMFSAISNTRSSIDLGKTKLLDSSTTQLNGQKIVFNKSSAPGYAVVGQYKPIQESTQPGGTAEFSRASLSYITLGFDDTEDQRIQTINRMHFSVTWVKPNDWNNIQNWWEEIWGGTRKHGKRITEQVIIKSNEYYSFFNYYSKTPVLSESSDNKYKYPAIGEVTSLLKAETAYWEDSPSYGSKYLYEQKSGGYVYNFDKTDRLNDSSKDLAKRKFYVVIPFNFVEKAVPESIDLVRIDGTIVSDGLDEDGNAFEDEEGDRYIDLKMGKNRAVAINGKDAKINRIEVSNYKSGVEAPITIQNADWNFNEQELKDIGNTAVFFKNEKRELDWTIPETKRYVFASYLESDRELVKDVIVRIYYDNTDDKNAYILNIMDKDGKFLPEGWIVPQIRRASDFDKIMRIVQVVLVILVALVLLYLVYKLIKLIMDILSLTRQA